jgi:hypothetical protein
VKACGESDSRSPEARKIYKKRFRERNPEKLKEARRAEYEKNREKEKRDHLKWSQKPDVILRRVERQKAAYQADPERLLKKIAKNILSRTMKVSESVLPADLVSVEMERLRLNRLIKTVKRACR